MDNISKHISYEEATYSNTAKRLGIVNKPTFLQLVRMKLIALCIFEPLREYFKVPIHVSSMFRSLRLNKAIKGAKNSQHLANNGAAMDLDADKYGGITNEDIFNYIKDNLEFDQLIAEFELNGQPKWIHVSYKAVDNRREILIATKVKNKTKYIPYTKEDYERIYKKK